MLAEVTNDNKNKECWQKLTKELENSIFIFIIKSKKIAIVAQLVEHLLPKEETAGSSPVYRL